MEDTVLTEEKIIAIFRNERHKAIVNMLTAQAVIKEKLAAIVSKYNLTTQQYNVLAILKQAGENEMSTLDIRDRMIDRHSDSSRVVARMVVEGLVTKEKSTVDGRKVVIKLTDHGREVANKFTAEANDEIDNIISGLSDEDVFTLNDILERIK